MVPSLTRKVSACNKDRILTISELLDSIKVCLYKENNKKIYFFFVQGVAIHEAH